MIGSVLTFEILEASHIIPWNSATPNQRVSVNNGLLLCPTHHRLYDYGLLWVDENYRIVLRDPNEKEQPFSTSDKFMTSKLGNVKINLPKNKKHYPNKEYLKKRNSIIEVEQI